VEKSAFEIERVTVSVSEEADHSARFRRRNKRKANACANLASMRCFARVPHNMVHKMLFPGERLFANIAAMRGLSCMLSNMVHHVFLAGERLGAIIAAVRSLAWRKQTDNSD